ncbi:MAG: hypothetical protein IJ404_07155 [Clostridia bacterium]|nr:hypothetical protein [Clostridia bacterium]
MTEKLLDAIKEINMNTEEAVCYGEDNYIITVAYDTDAMAYKVFESRLRERGYSLRYDNEQVRSCHIQRKEIYDYVRCVSYEKDGIFCTLTYLIGTKTTYLCISQTSPLSPHLKRSVSTDEKRNAKTTLHNIPLKAFGNSFLIQLKNRHFIISDGGFPGESVYLLNYMKGLLPEGEKPVVEAWFISHLHRDHCGLLGDFIDGTSDAESITVDGFYFNTPSEDVFELDMGAKEDERKVREAAKLFMTSDGGHPTVFRPRIGQRYYFDDISIDIVFTQEQLPRNCYYSTDFLKNTKRSNFNDSSTWCMLNIEEQKVLLTGDADKGSMDHVMNIYDRDYFKLTAVDTPHHSWNPYMPFDLFIEADTVLVTDRYLATPASEPQTGNWYYPNEVLAERSKEVLELENGPTVLEFPYRVGSYKYGEKRQK